MLMKIKAQSTVEYLLLITAVLGVFIVLLVGQNSIFKQRVTNTFNIAASDMVDIANRLSKTHCTPKNATDTSCNQ